MLDYQKMYQDLMEIHRRQQPKGQQQFQARRQAPTTVPQYAPIEQQQPAQQPMQPTQQPTQQPMQQPTQQDLMHEPLIPAAADDPAQAPQQYEPIIPAAEEIRRKERMKEQEKIAAQQKEFQKRMEQQQRPGVGERIGDAVTGVADTVTDVATGIGEGVQRAWDWTTDTATQAAQAVDEHIDIPPGVTDYFGRMAEYEHEPTAPPRATAETATAEPAPTIGQRMMDYEAPRVDTTEGIEVDPQRSMPGRTPYEAMERFDIDVPGDAPATEPLVDVSAIASPRMDEETRQQLQEHDIQPMFGERFWENVAIASDAAYLGYTPDVVDEQIQRREQRIRDAYGGRDQAPWHVQAGLMAEETIAETAGMLPQFLAGSRGIDRILQGVTGQSARQLPLEQITSRFKLDTKKWVDLFNLPAARDRVLESARKGAGRIGTIGGTRSMIDNYTKVARGELDPQQAAYQTAIDTGASSALGFVMGAVTGAIPEAQWKINFKKHGVKPSEIDFTKAVGRLEGDGYQQLKPGLWRHPQTGDRAVMTVQAPGGQKTPVNTIWRQLKQGATEELATGQQGVTVQPGARGTQQFIERTTRPLRDPMARFGVHRAEAARATAPGLPPGRGVAPTARPAAETGIAPAVLHMQRPARTMPGSPMPERAPQPPDEMAQIAGQIPARATPERPPRTAEQIRQASMEEHEPFLEHPTGKPIAAPPYTGAATQPPLRQQPPAEQMTFDEVAAGFPEGTPQDVLDRARASHRASVEEAVAVGRSVPDRVLQEYPEIEVTTPQPEATPEPVAPTTEAVELPAPEAPTTVPRPEDVPAEQRAEIAQQLPGQRSKLSWSDNMNPLLEDYGYRESEGDPPGLQRYQQKAIDKISRGEYNHDRTFIEKPTASFEEIGLDPNWLIESVEGGLKHEEIRISDQKVKQLAESIKQEGVTEAPYINIDAQGRAWVNEGNHRIRAAIEAGVDRIPVHVEYFDGGHRAQTTWKPDNLVDVAENPPQRIAPVKTTETAPDPTPTGHTPTPPAKAEQPAEVKPYQMTRSQYLGLDKGADAPAEYRELQNIASTDVRFKGKAHQHRTDAEHTLEAIETGDLEYLRIIQDRYKDTKGNRARKGLKEAADRAIKDIEAQEKEIKDVVMRGEEVPMEVIKDYPHLTPLSPAEKSIVEPAREFGFDPKEEARSMKEDAAGQTENYIQQELNLMRGELAEGGVERRIVDPERGVYQKGFSKNPPWYQEYYDTHQKKPTKDDMRQIAKRNLKQGRFLVTGEFVPPEEGYLRAIEKYKAMKTLERKLEEGMEDAPPLANRVEAQDWLLDTFQQADLALQSPEMARVETFIDPLAYPTDAHDAAQLLGFSDAGEAALVISANKMSAKDFDELITRGILDLDRLEMVAPGSTELKDPEAVRRKIAQRADELGVDTQEMEELTMDLQLFAADRNMLRRRMFGKASGMGLSREQRIELIREFTGNPEITSSTQLTDKQMADFGDFLTQRWKQMTQRQLSFLDGGKHSIEDYGPAAERIANQHPKAQTQKIKTEEEKEAEKKIKRAFTELSDLAAKVQKREEDGYQVQTEADIAELAGYKVEPWMHDVVVGHIWNEQLMHFDEQMAAQTQQAWERDMLLGEMPTNFQKAFLLLKNFNPRPLQWQLPRQLLDDVINVENKTRKIMSDYGSVLNNAVGRLSNKERVEVATVLEGLRKPENVSPQVAQAAQDLRQNFFDPLFNRAVDAGVLKEEQYVEDYFSRITEKLDDDVFIRQGVEVPEAWMKYERTGKLQDYNRDVLDVGQIYLNALAKNIFVKPAMEKWKPVGKQMHSLQKEAMDDLFNDVLGRPTRSEQAVNEFMFATYKTLAGVFGKDVIHKGRPAQELSRFVVSATVQNTMGFSPLLAARNFTQIMLPMADMFDARDPMKPFRLYNKANKFLSTKEGKEFVEKYNNLLRNRTFIDGLEQMSSKTWKINDALDKTQEISMYLFKNYGDLNNVKADFMMRFFDAYEYKGYSIGEALKIANDGVARSQFTYDKLRAPIYRSPIGRILAMFTSWSGHLIEWMAWGGAPPVKGQTPPKSSRIWRMLAYGLMAWGTAEMGRRLLGLQLRVGPLENLSGHVIPALYNRIQDQEEVAAESYTTGFSEIISNMAEFTPEGMALAAEEMFYQMPGGTRWRSLVRTLRAFEEEDWEVRDHEGRLLYQFAGAGEALRSVLGETPESRDRWEMQDAIKQEMMFHADPEHSFFPRRPHLDFKNLEELWIRAEEIGLDPEEEFQEANSQARRYYYNKYFDAVLRQDAEAGEEYYEILQRLGATHSDIESSVRGRMEAYE